MAHDKESACQCKRHRRHSFDPWVGKIPWRRKWQPTPIFLPGKFHGQRSLAGCSPWGRKESDTTKHALRLEYVFIYLFWLSHTACGILVSRSEIDPGPLHWKRGVLTTGLPGKSLTVHFKDKNVWQKSSSFSSLQLFKNFLWIVSGTWGSGMNHLMRGRVFDEREEMCFEML